jgi:histidinol dehydrogenase
LFPATYEFTKGEAPEKVFGKMLSAFESNTAAYKSQAAKTGLTFDQAIVLASVIEKEAGNPNYVSSVSSVFHNRLKIGMPLQACWLPLATVGVYVPRGLVSTLVMCAVPALAAGVQRIVVATPPQGAGLVSAAARLLGLDGVWALGGPPAIAAFAYGTETIPRVDKICGPGGRYVNEAKLLVSREVAIDLPAGPSEVVVLAGSGADGRIAELELAAQAEHGPDSVCNVVSVNGDSAAALAEVDARAPEHLVVLGDDAEELASQVRNAGAIFVGPWSSVAAGDYATGGNHVLPTAGWARSTGGIGLETFLKPVTIQRVSSDGLMVLGHTRD